MLVYSSILFLSVLKLPQDSCKSWHTIGVKLTLRPCSFKTYLNKNIFCRHSVGAANKKKALNIFPVYRSSSTNVSPTLLLMKCQSCWMRVRSRVFLIILHNGRLYSGFSQSVRILRQTTRSVLHSVIKSRKTYATIAYGSAYHRNKILIKRFIVTRSIYWYGLKLYA